MIKTILNNSAVRFIGRLLLVSLVFSVGIMFVPSQPVNAAGNTYYVAVTGNDSNPGTEAKPWRTIVKASQVMVAGDTTFVKAGVYNEQIAPWHSGSAGNYISLKAYPGDSVVIDGAGLNVGNLGLFIFVNQSYWNIEGFEIRNSGYNGINIHAACNYFTLKNLKIHDTAVSGIFLDGDGVNSPSYITIDGCETYNTNSSREQESISLVTVSNFEVKNCKVHDVLGDKEGIDCKVGSTNGKVYNNEVYNTHLGIYIDAYSLKSSNISVYNNRLHDNLYGISIGGEQGAETELVSVYNNLVYHNTNAAITCWDSANLKDRVSFINNTLYNNGSGILLYGDASLYSGVVVRNNLIYSPTDQWGYSLLSYCPSYPTPNISIDHNLFKSSGLYYDYNKYGTDYILDQDAKLVNPDNLDFHLLGSSPARDDGLSSAAPSTDFEGTPRPQGASGDIGAYEYVEVKVTSISVPLTLSPSESSVLIGKSQAFTATGYDSGNNPITGLNLKWTVNNPAAGTINTQGVFTAGTKSGYYPGAVQVTAPDGSTASASVTVNSLTLVTIGNKTINEGSLLQFTVSANIPTDNLTYKASNLPKGASFDPVTHTFSWIPAYTQAGKFTGIKFTVSYGSYTASETITITVNNVNRPPVLKAIGNKAVTQGQSVVFTLSATDPDGDRLTYSALNLPSGASLSPSTGAFSWSTRNVQPGVYDKIVFQVSDGNLKASEAITITVNNVNRPPVLGAIGNKTITRGQTLTFTVSASDPDGDALTFYASNLPKGASFNPATRVFSWSTSNIQPGTYTRVRFGVSDGRLSDYEDISITVKN